MMTDTIADMLTRIRNAIQRKHKSVTIPSSKIKKQIVQILLDEGYISHFWEKKFGIESYLRVILKYKGDDHTASIRGLKRISKPGLRVYSQAYNLPRVLNGLGIAIISTSKGIMTDRQANSTHLGGEVLAYIW